MYRITCDGFPLLDLRDEKYIVTDPKCNLEVNTVGEAAFVIYSKHPHYTDMQKLKSVFEISDDNGVIFRGRMTDDTVDFNLGKAVDLEGVMGFFNDSDVAPFNFPDDFENDAEYIAAAESGNVIEFFLKWLIDQHNSQVDDFQQLKMGNVTVTDPNNYLSRSSEEIASTWETLNSKLFGSSLGGYMCIRYEDDGNYVDYLADFEYTNPQKVVFGENLLDLVTESDAQTTYSAIIPIGAEIEPQAATEGEETEGTAQKLTLESIPDGMIQTDVYKITLGNGLHALYSKSAREERGWICSPISETTWEDVKEVQHLLTKGVAHLLGTAVMLLDTIEVKAADLHFTDKEVQSFRLYRYVEVESTPHSLQGRYKLTKLELDLLHPENTVIVLGETKKTLTDQNYDRFQNVEQKIESTKNDLKGYVASIERGLTQKIAGIDGIYFYIKYSQYADGHVMTDVPDENTVYMGTCSTNSETAPTNYEEYTWTKVRGSDGQDGKDGQNGTAGAAGKDGQSQYFHVKYSNDGVTFTANNGETLGDWMGTCVDTTEADPTDFDAYTWRKIVGEDGKDGIDGADGKDGQSNYFYVKFSANANGNPMTETPDENTKYMGVCSTTATTAPTSYSSYKWTQCRGNDGQDGQDGKDGAAGAAGADGRTQYLHIKYSDDGETFTENDGETLGAYIGTLVDFTEADSTTFSDYTWKKFTEDVDEELEEIRTSITEQHTELINTCDSIILEALKSYTETSNFEEFKQTVEAQLKLLADSFTVKFDEKTAELKEVNGAIAELQKFNSTFFTFDINGFTIGKSDNPNKVVLTNDTITITVNGIVVQSFDADGRALIPELKITKLLNWFGDYAIEKDSNGIVSCAYVGE